MRPLFKWTGGKNRMKEKYGLAFWPDQEFNLFVDAFYGSGSVTHWVADRYPNAEFIINDDNKELITLYRNLRDCPEWFCDRVAEIERDYLIIPADDNTSRMAYYNEFKMSYINQYKDMKSTEESALLYFMMKVNFNGWWKTYNYSNGRYATPPGTVGQRKSFIDYQLLRETSEFFKERVRYIMNDDFAAVSLEANPKSYLYFDPPYRDSYGYADEAFDDSDHLRLCELMKQSDQLGASVSMSNKETGDGFWQQHLGDMEILEYDAKYTAGRGTATIDVREVLIRNFRSEVSPLERLF
jgi:DNA adenine methylase